MSKEGLSGASPIGYIGLGKMPPKIARTGSQDIMTDRQTGNGPAFGHLRLVDYVVVIYCVLRILGEKQGPDLDAKD